MASAPPRDPIPRLSELPLELVTPRLRLRPVAHADVDELFAHASDPEVARPVSWAVHRDRAETAAFVQEYIDQLANGTDVVFSILLDGKAVGCVGLHGIRWENRAWRIDRAELGYWVARPLWGQGYASEAANAATRWAFETLGLHKVTVGCVATNEGSRRVIEKLGFRYLCRQEEDFWRDGQWQDHLRYELTAAEWADTTRTLRFMRRPKSEA